MMGGAHYDKYFNCSLEQDSDKLLKFALNALKKQIKLDVEPKKHKISILKVNITSLILWSHHYIFFKELNSSI
jgi:hypothetical protein